VQLGLVATAFTITYGCLVPIGGFLGDFMSRKKIVFTSILIFSLGTLCTGFCGGLLSLIIVRGITSGGGEAFYYPSATSLISQYHKKTRAMAMSIHQTSLYVGIVASGFIAGYIGEHFGWRSSFTVFGIGGLFVSVYLWFRLKNTPNETNRPGKKLKLSFVIKEIFKRKTVWLLCIAFGCMCFVNIGYVTWMSTYYYEAFHLSLSTAGFTSMFYHFSAALIGVLIGGQLSDKMAVKDRKARIRTEFIGLLCGAPFIYLMASTTNLYVSYAMLALFGFFRGIYDSNLYAALYDVIEPELRASSVGIMTAFAFVVGALAPLGIGALKNIYGLSFGISLLSVFYLTGALALFIAMRFFFLKEFYVEK
jgi:MFS family permease